MTRVDATLPAPLREVADKSWKMLQEHLENQGLQGSPVARACDERSKQVRVALALSDFLAHQLIRHLEDIEPLLTGDQLDTSWEEGCWPDWWEQHWQPAVDSEQSLQRCLRRFRRQAQFCIVWRDLLGLASLDETLGAISELADTCIQQALAWLYDDSCRQWGTPMAPDPETGEPRAQQLVVLGMGKLGARELNVSSDIDLIFAYEGKGETRGVDRPLENQQFFTRLGQRLIQALDQPTADGFVFRVDMRLRPYGQSGALALSFPALETYYQDQGREWERYAMIKARVVAGDQAAGQRLMSMLKPFVYRRYIDFSAFESLREMKAMINREVRRKGLENNIKLGPGGIREVEFIAQAFQLIRGGRDARLQRRELMAVIRQLGEAELLPPPAAEELIAAYRFLRRAEHVLQGMEDRQTQTLPEDELGRLRLAHALDFPDWGSFQAALARHRQRVNAHFADLIAAGDEDADRNTPEEGWQELWLGELGPSAAADWLEARGFEEPEQVLVQLEQLRESRQLRAMQRQGMDRLNQFMPRLLQALSRAEHPTPTLERVLKLVQAVARRSAYLLLLNENPAALEQLVSLCDASPWIADELAATPLLLDELLNAESLYSPPEKASLRDELRQQLLRIPAEDLEEQMECLRHFKKAHVLRVAASELGGTLPLMKVSDYLTWIAEVVLEQVVLIAWDSLVARYGHPDGVPGSPGRFAVVGYGKLGGIELGYTSDLDLVFVHDADPLGSTDGEKPLDNAVFFTRLGQRIVHILSTRTPSGQLYEVDMRLRPSGSAGLLVSSLAALERYQREEAWTWEHQALVRARWIAGCPETGERFEALRRELLCRERDPEALRAEVVAMRERMREAHGTPEGEEREKGFHLKQDPGGIIDIEFMVQYLILAWAHRCPDALGYSDNIRQMEALGRCGILDEGVAQRLRECYITMRSTIHRRALQNLNSRVFHGAFPEERAYVRGQWKRLMEEPGSG